MFNSISSIKTSAAFYSYYYLGSILLMSMSPMILVIAQTLTNPAMFSDMLLVDYQNLIENSTVYIDDLLGDTALVDRYEATKYCANLNQVSTSLLTKILLNSNYSKNSFESKQNYFSCNQIYELYCNSLIPNKYVVTHSLFDCEDFLVPEKPTLSLMNDPNNSTYANRLKIISLSPSTLQLASVLGSFLNRYNLRNYGIVFAETSTNISQIDLVYYKQFASNLIYRLSLNSAFSLDFSYSLYDSNLANVFSSNVKIIFLILRCGEEVNFMNMYWNKIIQYEINVIAVYNSPQCIPMLSYDNAKLSSLNSNERQAYHRLYKLVPIDYWQNDYASYSNVLLNIIKKNVMNEFRFSYALDELENYYFLENYDNIQNITRINTINDYNATIDLKCFLNGNLDRMDSFRYCYRRFMFTLFGLSGNSTKYSQLAQIYLTDLDTYNTKLNVSIQMPFNSTFQVAVTTTASNDEIFKNILFGIIGVIILIVLVVLGAYLVRSRIMRKELSTGPNKILLLPEDLEFSANTSSELISRSNVRDANKQNETSRSNVSMKSDEHAQENMKDNKFIRLAKYKGDIVVVKFLKIPNFQIKNSTIRELRKLRDLRHENLNTFLGCYIDIKSPSLIFEYATRGSLQDIILKKDIKLDWNFKWSMLNDLCRGMRYIHHSPIKYHGNLKSRNCIVDSRWVLKLTDFGLPCIYSNQKYSRTLNLSDLLWTAPEHLRQTTIRDQVVLSIGSPLGDIYSFGIIMQEVIVRGVPFCMLGLSEEEIISKIRKPPPLLRPSVSKTAAPPEYVNIMRDCWSEQPELRPSFDQLCSMFKSLNGDKKVNIVDLMFKMIEQYTNNLEDLVKEKTVKLEEEKKKSEKLLMEMLPKTVAESLIMGQTVQPESFDCVTIYFSDIVGFTTISAFSSPFEVVQLLNDLYTMFDEILTTFDCYKVETIGDAYMVVSGLPIRNGNKHAGEIATMALNLLHHCGQFRIKHLPGVPLRLRIGIHSGACVSGVVGLKMPRYCLFGDTVNTASRMESTSQAYRIHVSESAADILKEIGGYKLDFRGETELKGKGKHKTYWLVGQDGFDKPLPDPFVSDNNHGIDSELIDKIKKIRAEQQKLREENPGLFQANLAAPQPTNPIKSLSPNDETSSKSPRKSIDNLKMGSNTVVDSENENDKMEKSKARRKKSSSVKNDSGYSETTTNGTVVNGSGTLPSKLDSIAPNSKNNKQKRMPDIDSVA